MSQNQESPPSLLVAIKNRLNNLNRSLERRKRRLENLPSDWSSRASRRQLPDLPRPLPTSDWPGLNRCLKAYDEVALDDQRLTVKTVGWLVPTRKQAINLGLKLIWLLKRLGLAVYRPIERWQQKGQR